MSNSPALPNRSTNVPDNPEALPYQYQHQAYQAYHALPPLPAEKAFNETPTNAQTESDLPHKLNTKRTQDMPPN